MQIQQVTISYTFTQGLPGYSNVKPGISYTAVLEPGDSPAEVAARLTEMAEAYVHARVDEALMGQRLPPRFGTRESFDVLSRSHALAIVPAGRRPEESAGEWRVVEWELSLEVARQAVERLGQRRESAVVYDCSDGDWSRLPALAAGVPVLG